MRNVVMSVTATESIRSDCRRAYPDEACGMLIGIDRNDAREVMTARPMRNVAKDDEKPHRFRLDPAEQLAVERETEALGKMVVGFYHSHPDAPPIPSRTDVDEAWPFYSYLIVNVTKGMPDQIRCWTFDDVKKSFDEQPLNILDK